jgi:hypothetical protein
MVRNTGESLDDFAKRSLDGERGILRFRQREAKRRIGKSSLNFSFLRSTWFMHRLNKVKPIVCDSGGGGV